MKKGFLIGLISALSCAVIFLAVIMCAGIAGDKKWNESYSRRDAVFEETYRENEIESFNIFVSSADVQFLESETSKIDVKIFSNKKYNLSVNVSGKALNINLTRKGHSFGFLNLKSKMQKDEIVISVPKSFAGKIAVVSNLGDVSLDDMKDAVVDIQADLGNISLGKIKDAKIISHLGDVEIDEVLNWLDIDSSLGDVRIERVSLNKDSKIKSALGDVRIEKANGVYIEADVDLGDNRVKNNDKNAKTTLWIDSALGDVVVN